MSSGIQATLEGIVTKNGVGIGGAVITSSIGRSATTLPTGDYVLPHPAGTFRFTCDPPGPGINQASTITLAESETKIKNWAF